MPIPGPGMPREQQSLVQLRPQHIGPCAVVVGVTAYLLASVLLWLLAVPVLVGMMTALVYAAPRVAIDRVPTARQLRR